MRIGVVVHGPEAVYSGFAQRVLDVLEDHGEVEARLGGTMARCALFDVGEHRVKTLNEMPSESATALSECDVVVLASQSKTHQSAFAFGRMVSENSSCDVLVQVEPEMCVPWRGNNEEAAYIANTLSLRLVDPPLFSPNVRVHGSTVYRRVSGVLSGESIRVNGIVIARAVSSDVVIVEEHGKIVDVLGGVLKPEGIKKLGRVDIRSAIVRTGMLRGHVPERRVVHAHGSTIYLIDHDAEHCFELAPDAAGMITVGDDTTAIAADLLTRFSVPIIGIVDGDEDGSIPDGKVPVGSRILQVRAGHDDIVGGHVRRKVFGGGYRLHEREFDEVVGEVLDIASPWLVHEQAFLANDT